MWTICCGQSKSRERLTPFAIHLFGVTGTSASELNYAIAKASAADRDSIRNPDQFAIGKI